MRCFGHKHLGTRWYADKGRASEREHTPGGSSGNAVNSNGGLGALDCPACVHTSICAQLSVEIESSESKTLPHELRAGRARAHTHTHTHMHTHSHTHAPLTRWVSQADLRTLLWRLSGEEGERNLVVCGSVSDPEPGHCAQIQTQWSSQPHRRGDVTDMK